MRINEFNKIAGYKVNTQKSIVSLYISSKWLESEIFLRTIYSRTKKYKMLKNKYKSGVGGLAGVMQTTVTDQQ